MYHFGPAHRAALDRLPLVAQLAVTSWAEMTYEDTHPVLRCRPESGSQKEAAEAVIKAIEQ